MSSRQLASVTVFEIDPLRDPRWGAFVRRRAQASVFHTPAWLSALQRTYGYKPLAFTTSQPSEELQNGIVFCEVSSWLTGRRLVSLPFSDHCDFLVDSADDVSAVCTHLDAKRRTSRWRYIELRPQSESVAPPPSFRPSERFWFHTLDLSPGDEALFRAFSKDSIQGKIRRAEREQLAYDEGSSVELLRAFYRLLLMTRRRHKLPPQPFAWFRTLSACLGPAMKVRVAKYRGQPVAAIVTLRHRDTMVYKYGVSDAAFHNLGGVQLLFWRAIQEARLSRCTVFDLGRSDADDEGLTTFKDRWGATRTASTYWRLPWRPGSNSAVRQHAIDRAQQLLDRCPDCCVRIAGTVLYKHVG